MATSVPTSRDGQWFGDIGDFPDIKPFREYGIKLSPGNDQSGGPEVEAGAPVVKEVGMGNPAEKTTGTPTTEMCAERSGKVKGFRRLSAKWRQSVQWSVRQDSSKLLLQVRIVPPQQPSAIALSRFSRIPQGWNLYRIKKLLIPTPMGYHSFQNLMYTRQNQRGK